MSNHAANGESMETSSTAAILQRRAALALDFRMQHEAAKRDRDEAVTRLESVATSLRNAEAELVRAVGANLHHRIWQVDDVAVVAQWHPSGATTVTYVKTEPRK